MDDARDRPSAGQVLAGAIAAAGAAAGIAIGLGRLGESPHPPEILLSNQTLSDGVTTSAATVGQLAEALGHQMKVRAEIAAKEAPDRARAASRRIREESARLAERVPGEIVRAEAAVTTEAKRIGRRARQATRQGSEKGRDVAAAKVDLGKRQARRLSKETTSTTREIASQAVAQVERLLRTGASVSERTRSRRTAVARRGQRASADLTPALRRVAIQVASTALDLLQSTRDLALDAAESAEAGLDRSTDKASRVVMAQGDRVREVSEAAAERAAEIGDKAAEARNSARTIGRRTAEATVDTGKDTAATLFWTAAAAGLVFYALLDPAKREQTLQVARTATTQLQELIRDFQGYDDEF